jgi:hypothetical protein
MSTIAQQIRERLNIHELRWLIAPVTAFLITRVLIFGVVLFADVIFPNFYDIQFYHSVASLGYEMVCADRRGRLFAPHR